jgi:hypothetical protein
VFLAVICGKRQLQWQQLQLLAGQLVSGHVTVVTCSCSIPDSVKNVTVCRALFRQQHCKMHANDA